MLRAFVCAVTLLGGHGHSGGAAFSGAMHTSLCAMAGSWIVEFHTFRGACFAYMRAHHEHRFGERAGARDEARRLGAHLRTVVQQLKLIRPALQVARHQNMVDHMLAGGCAMMESSDNSGHSHLLWITICQVNHPPVGEVECDCFQCNSLCVFAHAEHGACPFTGEM